MSTFYDYINLDYHMLSFHSSDFKKDHFYPRPADSIGHSVRPSLRRPSVPPSLQNVQKNQIQISQLWNLIETWGFLVDLQILADRSRLLNIRSCLK